MRSVISLLSHEWWLGVEIFYGIAHRLIEVNQWKRRDLPTGLVPYPGKVVRKLYTDKKSIVPHLKHIEN